MYPRPLSGAELFDDKAIERWKQAEREAKAAKPTLDDPIPRILPFGYEPSGAHHNWHTVGSKPDYFSDASIKAFNDRARILGEKAAARMELDAMTVGASDQFHDRPRITLDEELGRPLLAPNGMVTAFFSDGACRRIETHSYGPKDAMPIIWLHGTPGSDADFLPGYSEDYCVIAASRHGYRGSTRHKDRIIADGAAWVLAIAKAYGHKRFIIAGRSGAGPYVLATAAFCPEVACAVVISSVAPNDNDGPATAAAGNVSASRAAVDNRPALWRRFKYEDDAGPTGVIDYSVRPDAGPADRALLDDLDIVRMLARSHSEGGAIGRYDDIIAKTRYWGYGLGDVRKPVVVIHGKNDRFATPDNYWKLMEGLPYREGELYKDVEHLGTAGAITDRALKRAVEISNEGLW